MKQYLANLEKPSMKKEPGRELFKTIHEIVHLDSFLSRLSRIIDNNSDLRVLNIGCGRRTLEAAVNIDIIKLDGINVVADIRKGLPFKDNTFDLIIAFNILEHLTVEEFTYTLKEMKRVSKDGALIKIHVPYFSSESAYSSIDHKIFFAYNTFWRYQEGDWDPTTPKLFSDVSIKLVWHTNKSLKILNFVISKIINAHYLIAMFYQHFFCWIFPMKALDVVCEVKKERIDR